jgi:large subunit ribosomal protein L18
MYNRKLKRKKRQDRHSRVRTKISGTDQRPRVSLHCSHKNLSVQLIDDLNQRTLLSISTLDKELKEKIKSGGNLGAAKLLGEALSKRAKEKSIAKVVLDKGHLMYHGRIKAFTDAARQGGLKL